MPRKKNRAKSQRKGMTTQRSKKTKSKQGQGPLSNIVDTAANTIKGIGRGVLPGLFKTMMVDAPTNVGIVAPRATYRMSNQAQRLADFDPDRSIRITGNGLFADAVMRRNGEPGLFLPIAGVNPFPAWRGVSPLSVDPRAFEVAITYQFYAFRLLRFTWIPSTGTSGELTQVNLAFGISQDSQEYIDLPNPQPVQMLEQNRSILTPAWTPCTLTYEHDGTRTWSTNPNGEGTIDEFTQCLFGGVASGPGIPGEEHTIGQLYMEYVLDLYEPQPVQSQGGYTVALPHFVDGNGFITGDAFQNGETLYPDGYNHLITGPVAFDPTPPAEEEMKVSSVDLDFSKPLKFLPRGKSHRSTRLGARLAHLERFERSLRPPKLLRTPVDVDLPRSTTASVSNPSLGDEFSPKLA